MIVSFRYLSFFFVCFYALLNCWFCSVITVDFNSFAPLSLLGHPVLVVALEKVERSSGTLIGSSIATIQKSAAPEVIFRIYSRSYG